MLNPKDANQVQYSSDTKVPESWLSLRVVRFSLQSIITETITVNRLLVEGLQNKICRTETNGRNFFWPVSRTNLSRLRAGRRFCITALNDVCPPRLSLPTAFGIYTISSAHMGLTHLTSTKLLRNEGVTTRLHSLCNEENAVAFAFKNASKIN